MTGTRNASPYGPAWSASLRRGTDAELRGWVESALGWCDAADRIALEWFSGNPVTTDRPDRSFVTEADTAVGRLIRERIADAYPDHGVLGEEYGMEGAAATVRWIVDPIDGRHSFLRESRSSRRSSGSSATASCRPGIISAPAMGARWYAWRGGGAWAAGPLGGGDRVGTARRINVTAVRRARRGAGDLGGHPGRREERPGAGLCAASRAGLARAPIGESWGYGPVAEGAAEVMLEVGLTLRDVAAPAVLVEEAGGRITDFQGRRIFDGGTTLASNGVLHDEVLRILAER